VIVVSIDPGWSGGIVWGDIATSDMKSCRCPDSVGEMAKLIEMISPEKAFLEQVHSGIFHKVANFKLGQNFGIWCGILAAMKIPYETVSPQTWQSRIRPKKTTKEFEIKKAVWKAMKANYPGTLGKKYRPCESHVADALGVLDYYRSRV
jgi:hypothetical protein